MTSVEISYEIYDISLWIIRIHIFALGFSVGVPTTPPWPPEACGESPGRACRWWQPHLPVMWRPVPGVEKDEEAWRSVWKSCQKETRVFSKQIIATSAEVTPTGGLLREIPPNPLNSGLGIIINLPSFLPSRGMMGKEDDPFLFAMLKFFRGFYIVKLEGLQLLTRKLAWHWKIPTMNEDVSSRRKGWFSSKSSYFSGRYPYQLTKQSHQRVPRSWCQICIVNVQPGIFGEILPILTSSRIFFSTQELVVVQPISGI